MSHAIEGKVEVWTFTSLVEMFCYEKSEERQVSDSHSGIWQLQGQYIRPVWAFGLLSGFACPYQWLSVPSWVHIFTLDWRAKRWHPTAFRMPLLSNVDDSRLSNEDVWWQELQDTFELSFVPAREVLRSLHLNDETELICAGGSAAHWSHHDSWGAGPFTLATESRSL
jgi:hypothetical protein